MTAEKFLDLLQESRDRRDGIMLGKGVEYQTTADFLANFKQVADMVDVTPLLVWAIYFHKHVCSIMKYVQTGKDSAEGIESRFDDCANYLALGWALIQELVDHENITPAALGSNVSFSKGAD